jgi:type IV secretory pathway ATPase VirB11/archaellum biosynthesis ATPase
MVGALESRFLRLIQRRGPRVEPPPLLVELLPKPGRREDWGYGHYPFLYRVSDVGGSPFYEISCDLGFEPVAVLRQVVNEISQGLDPREVYPLTFQRLVEVLYQHAAERLAAYGIGARVRELSELASYEAIGLSRVLALAKDEKVTEFFVDSEVTPVYLDHAVAGRCESGIMLTERERGAIETHVDTFGGYTIDYRTPSLKNELIVGGAILRVSLDLEPVSVNRFALDVRRLNTTSLSLPRLVAMGVLSLEAAAMLVAWLETGGNVTIVGETGTGKTTLLNALDEAVDRRFRRLYIEDAVETKDLLERGYHQMKVKVDPFERGDDAGRTKESEIVKALHRSPDIVILGEIQSEEHSRAFFQALSAGARGMQTFHASTPEQAIRRWTGMHHVATQNILDLGLMVQMTRPDRLKQGRFVRRVCALVADAGAPRLKELFTRDGGFSLREVSNPSRDYIPDGIDPDKLRFRIGQAKE